MKFERTFVVKAPVERAWKAFTRPEEREAWMSPPGHDPVGSPEAGWPGTGLAKTEVKPGKVERHRLLQWVQTARPNDPVDPGWVEMTVVFEEVESGTRITLTQSGFGDRPDWQSHIESVGLGTDESIKDLILYLETGVRAVRHHSWKSSVGATMIAAPAGLRIVDVSPGGFAAQAGLLPDDLLVRLGGGPVFGLSDVGFVERAFAPGTELDVEFVRGSDLHRGQARLSEAFYTSKQNRAA
jgi:uncharacterized protein YndB with AHSA1/START domain